VFVWVGGCGCACVEGWNVMSTSLVSCSHTVMSMVMKMVMSMVMSMVISYEYGHEYGYG
jgi:hypothetical protein